MGGVQERIYREIFFLKSFRDAKVEEFYRLEQGDFSVPEYEKKFSELIRLVPFFAENEQEKINRFMTGLNPAVRTIVTSASHTRYGQLVEAATRVEQSTQTALKSNHNSVRRGTGLAVIRERPVRCLRVVSAQHGHRVGNRVRDPRPVRVLLGHQ